MADHCSLSWEQQYVATSSTTPPVYLLFLPRPGHLLSSPSCTKRGVLGPPGLVGTVGWLWQWVSLSRRAAEFFQPMTNRELDRWNRVTPAVGRLEQDAAVGEDTARVTLCSKASPAGRGCVLPSPSFLTERFGARGEAGEEVVTMRLFCHSFHE